MPRPTETILCVLLFLAAAGCRTADPAIDRTQRAVTMLIDTRRALIESETVVADSQAALRALQGPSLDLREVFGAFERQTDRVRKEADRVRVEAETLRAESKTYAAARQTDVKTIANAELREAAEARTAEVVTRYERIDGLHAKLSLAFTEYVRALDDLRTYLANDLNHPALQSARRWLDEAQTAGETLRGRIRALTEELHTTSNVLSPVPLPATKWNTAATRPATLPPAPPAMPAATTRATTQPAPQTTPLR